MSYAIRFCYSEIVCTYRGHNQRWIFLMTIVSNVHCASARHRFMSIIRGRSRVVEISPLGLIAAELYGHRRLFSCSIVARFVVVGTWDSFLRFPGGPDDLSQSPLIFFLFFFFYYSVFHYPSLLLLSLSITRQKGVSGT